MTFTEPFPVDATKEMLADIFLKCTQLAPVSIQKKGNQEYPHWAGYAGILNPREIFVLIKRFGLIDGKSSSLRSIAAEMGFKTGERTRQLEARALRNLRTALRKHPLKDKVFEQKP